MARAATTNISSNTNIHAGRGSVISLIINHSESTTQTVNIYDSLVAAGTILASFKVSPDSSPKHIIFPAPYYLRFSTGLTIEPGNCTVIIQSVGS